MARDALRRDVDAARDLLDHLHGGVAHLPLFADGVAALGNAVLGVDGAVVLGHHVADAEVRLPFLAGFGQQNHVAVEWHVEPLEQQERHHRRGQVVLVVDGAAAVHEAAVARGAEGRERPLRGIDGDRVEMPEDEERPLRAVALEARHHVGTLRIERVNLRRDTFAVEERLQPVRFRFLGDARVEADERLVDAERFGLHGRPVGLRGPRLRAERGDGGNDERGRDEPQ
jgi:hypothetical protein